MTDSEYIEKGMNGDLLVAMKYLDKKYPINSLTMKQDPSGCSAEVVVWPNGLTGEFFHFTNVGESIAECIILCIKDVEGYKESGTNYQSKEMG